MKKILICLLTIVTFSCHPDVIEDYPEDDVIWVLAPEKVIDNENNNINGNLEIQ